MKEDTRPLYGPVGFRDPSAETRLFTRSTIIGRLGADHPQVTLEAEAGR